MSTNSRIGIQNEDGSISSIYCHWDGYPEYNGKILMEHYQDRQKIQNLINLGDISVLGKLVEFCSDMNVPNQGQFQNFTISYHRDRGEKYRPPTIDTSLESFVDNLDEPFGYVYTLNDKWKIFKPKDKNIINKDGK